MDDTTGLMVTKGEKPERIPGPPHAAAVYTYPKLIT